MEILNNIVSLIFSLIIDETIVAVPYLDNKTVLDQMSFKIGI